MFVEITYHWSLGQEDGCNQSEHLPEREVRFGDSLQAKESGQQKDCAEFYVKGVHLTADAVWGKVKSLVSQRGVPR